MWKIIRIFLVFVLLCAGVLGYYTWQCVRESKPKKGIINKKNNVYITTITGGAVRVLEGGSVNEYPLQGKPTSALTAGVADVSVMDGFHFPRNFKCISWERR